MLSIKDIIKTGIQDLKSHRKTNVISFVLIFLSLTVYLGVNSYCKSINDEIDKSVNSFVSRIIFETCLEEQYESVEKLIFDEYSKDKRVREVSEFYFECETSWLDTEEYVHTKDNYLHILNCFEAVFDYDYKGEKKKPDVDEIIIPRYMFDIGVYDEKNFFNGDELIGKTIKLQYSTYNDLDRLDYEFKVIGTYDNLEARTKSTLSFVNLDVMLEIKEMDDKADLELNLLLNEGLPVEEQYIPEPQRYFAMYVKESEDVDKFINDIKDETELVNPDRYVMADPTVIGYYEYVAGIGNLISILLLLIGVVNIIISSLNEVKERKWEFALKMSMGYTRSDITKVFFIEKLINLFKALVLSIITVGLFCAGITCYSKMFLEYWKKTYLYLVYPDNVVIAIVVVSLTALISVIAARESIKNIEVAKELKSDN